MDTRNQTPSESEGTRLGADDSAGVEHKLGSVQVSPKVLATLARLTAASVPGIVRVGRPAPRFVSWLRWLPWKRPSAGVDLEMRPDGVCVAIEIVVAQGKNVVDVASQAQGEIATAIEKMVGFPVRQVNVRVVDVR